MPKKKIELSKHAISELTVKHEFIRVLVFSFDVDINRIRLKLYPIFESIASIPTAEITVEAIPTSLTVYSLAAISQKKKPVILPTMEFATR